MNEKIFKCVPLNNSWVLPGTKLDLKAIYRRPRRTTDEYDQVVQERGPDGRPLYDIVGPLPMRRHQDWLAKGFEYVTVFAQPHTEGPEWGAVANWLRANQQDPRDFLQHPQLGTWNPKLYLASADRVDIDRFATLRRLVEQFGSDAVLAIRRQEDPKFELPPDLQGVEAGASAPVLRNQAGASVDGGAEVPGPAPKRAAASKKASAKPASKPAPAEVAQG